MPRASQTTGKHQPGQLKALWQQAGTNTLSARTESRLKQVPSCLVLKTTEPQSRDFCLDLIALRGGTKNTQATNLLEGKRATGSKRSYPFVGQAGQPVGLQRFVNLVKQLVLSHCPTRPGEKKQR